MYKIRQYFYKNPSRSNNIFTGIYKQRPMRILLRQLVKHPHSKDVTAIIVCSGKMPSIWTCIRSVDACADADLRLTRPQTKRDSDSLSRTLGRWSWCYRIIYWTCQIQNASLLTAAARNASICVLAHENITTDFFFNFE